MSFIDYLTYVMNSPLLFLLTILVLGLMIVNGKTDAPNAIATAITTTTMMQNTAQGMMFALMIRPSFPLVPVVAHAETTLLTQTMLPIAPPLFCRATIRT